MSEVSALECQIETEIALAKKAGDLGHRHRMNLVGLVAQKFFLEKRIAKGLTQPSDEFAELQRQYMDTVRAQSLIADRMEKAASRMNVRAVA